MKSRETKHKDLTALTESLQNSTSAMVVSFSGVTVAKDQEFRNSLREAGARYEVVKNTLARIAVKGTQFEDASEFFKGVTAIAWTDNDPVVLSKAISKFVKDNEKQYTFKTGVVDGKLVDLVQLTTIANLPSKDELISKLLFVLQSGAQRLVTVINAVPRDLAVVIKQIGEQKPVAAAPAEEVKAEAPAPAPAVEEAAPVEAEVAAEAPAEEAPAAEAAPAEEASAEAVAEPVADEAPAVEAEAAPAAEVAESADEAPAEIEAAGEETAEAATEEAAEPTPEADAEEKAE